MRRHFGHSDQACFHHHQTLCTSIMTFSTASSRESFESHGFCVVHDEDIGRTVKEVDDQGLATDAKSWEHFDDFVKRHAVS